MIYYDYEALPNTVIACDTILGDVVTMYKCENGWVWVGNMIEDNEVVGYDFGYFSAELFGELVMFGTFEIF